MREARCKVCGEELGRRSVRESIGAGVGLVFIDVCEFHIDVLTRAFHAVAEALTLEHKEQQERILAQLFDRLQRNGFEMPTPITPPAYYRRQRVSSNR